MSVVFAAPGAVHVPPPPSGERLYRGLKMSWTGWDGSVWPLTAHRSGLVLRNDGVEGLDEPPMEFYETSSPGVHGSRARGWRAQKREAFLPILMYRDSTLEWMQQDRAFWRTLQPLRYGVWTVEHPITNERRYLHCRHDGDPHAFPLDPFRKGWAKYGIGLVADEEPFWLGDPVTRRFVIDAPADFFGGGLGAPEFYISGGNNVASASVNNPGDLEAWPIWEIEGPMQSVRVGLNGLQVEVPFPILEGERIVIDTRPHQQVAYRRRPGQRDEEVTHLLGAAEFVAIPAGNNIRLDLEALGTGAVRVSFDPRYLRAW